MRETIWASDKDSQSRAELGFRELARHHLRGDIQTAFRALYLQPFLCFAEAPVAIISCVKPSTLWWIGIDFIITAVCLLMAFTIRSEGRVTAK